VGCADAAADANGPAECRLELGPANGDEVMEVRAQVERRGIAAGEADAAGGVERAVAPACMERAELDRVPGRSDLHANLLVGRAGRRQHQMSVRECRAALDARGDARPAEPRVQREAAPGLPDMSGSERAGEAEIQAVRMYANRERLARRVPSRSAPREVDRHRPLGAKLARLGVAEEAVQGRLPLLVAGV